MYMRGICGVCVCLCGLYDVRCMCCVCIVHVGGEVWGVCGVRCVGSVGLRTALGVYYIWGPSAEVPYKDQVFLNSLANSYMPDKHAKPHVSITYWTSARWCFNTLTLCLQSDLHRPWTAS